MQIGLMWCSLGDEIHKLLVEQEPLAVRKEPCGERNSRSSCPSPLLAVGSVVLVSIFLGLITWPERTQSPPFREILRSPSLLLSFFWKWWSPVGFSSGASSQQAVADCCLCFQLPDSCLLRWSVMAPHWAKLAASQTIGLRASLAQPKSLLRWSECYSEVRLAEQVDPRTTPGRLPSTALHYF